MPIVFVIGYFFGQLYAIITGYKTMIEYKTIRDISPHITDLDKKVINRPAEPGDSIFTTPEGLAFSFPIHTLATYIDTPDSDRPPLLREVAKELVSHPEQIDYFWNQMTTVDRMKSRGEHLKSALSPVLKEVASEIDTFSLTETQLIALFRTLHPPSLSDEERNSVGPANSIWTGLLRGTIHESMLGTASKHDRKNPQLDSEIIKGKLVLAPKTIEERLESKNIGMSELQYTQDRIAHLLYTLTTAVMGTHDERLLRELYKLLSFQTSSLKEPLLGLFMSAGKSFNDTAFTQFTLIDHTNELLGTMFKIEPREILTGRMRKMLEHSPAGLHYILEADRDVTRAQLFEQFYKERVATLGLSAIMDTDSLGEYFTRPLSFPENILYAPKKLWYQYIEYYSMYCLENGWVNSPVLPLSLPDGTVRHVAVQEIDNRLAAREIIKYAAENGTPSEITNSHVIDSFFSYAKPNLLETTFGGLEHNNKQKQATLLTQACHGIPKVGVHIAIDQDQHPEIAASMLSFDQSGTFINVTIGNYILKLQLNNEYELCYADGKPLEVDEQTKIWWKHVILPPLAELICKSPEEHEGYIEGTQGLSHDERMAAAKHTILKRIGHIRHLGITPDGKEKHNTPEQRDRVLTLDYPLPHTPKLDLYELNTTTPFDEFGNKVTYVLPVERELTETPVFYLPHAYDESQDLLDRDPNR